MKQAEDLTGKKFGRWTVLSRIDTHKHLCRCTCGAEVAVWTYQLQIHRSRGCRQCSIANAAKQMIGQRFGRLVVVARADPPTRWNNANWLCKCDCGKLTTVIRPSLITGDTTSCGCLANEIFHKNNHGKSGSAHPNWNPALSDADRQRARLGEGDRMWRVAIYKKGDYKCEVCGADRRSLPRASLCAHHLESYAHCPELRTDIDNGVCMCLECHREFHSCYGERKFTRQDYECFKQHKQILATQTDLVANTVKRGPNEEIHHVNKRHTLCVASSGNASRITS